MKYCLKFLLFSLFLLPVSTFPWKRNKPRWKSQHPFDMLHNMSLAGGNDTLTFFFQYKSKSNIWKYCLLHSTHDKVIPQLKTFCILYPQKCIATRQWLWECVPVMSWLIWGPTTNPLLEPRLDWPEWNDHYCPGHPFTLIHNLSIQIHPFNHS